MREVLILAVVKAADDVDRPQYVRLGKSWITNDTGRKIRVTPRSLPRADLIIYLRKCAYTHANEAVGWVPPWHPGSELLPADALEELKEAGRAGAGHLQLRMKATRAARLLDASDITLSRRQREVLELSRDRHATREIAENLGITESTVRVHRHRAYRKGRG